MSSLVLFRKSFLINPSLFRWSFQYSLQYFPVVSVFLGILRCLILSPVSVFVQNLSQHNEEEQSHQQQQQQPLAVIAYFPFENVTKHGFFYILSPQSILLVPSFPRMKSGNCLTFVVEVSIGKREMLFGDVQRKNSATQIPFTETPFIILGKKKLDCTHGVDGCISSKRKRLQAKLNKVCNIQSFNMQRKIDSSATIFHASATKAIEAISNPRLSQFGIFFHLITKKT